MKKIQELKARLRQKVEKLLSKISPSERRIKSSAICKNILSHPLYRRSRSVMFFFPKDDEPDITPLIKMELKRNLRRKNRRLVCAPRVVGGDIKIGIVKKLGRNLKKGAFGILEPQNYLRGDFSPELVIVPARAYDLRGGRLGRGLGYYDRFLGNLDRSTRTIGVCFEECFFKKQIPAGRNDIPVGVVITDKRIKENNNGRK